MHRPRPAVYGLVAGLLAVVLAVGTALWNALVPSDGGHDGPTFSAMVLAFTGVYGTTGAVLAWHGVAPFVRRVLLGIALTQGAAGLATAYAHRALEATPAWPQGELALWLGSWLWAPAYVAVGAVLPLVLPDGRPVWRWSAWLSGVAVAWAGLSWALSPYELQDFPRGGGWTNPVGVAAVASRPVVVGGAVLILAAVAAALTSLVVRYRRAQGPLREQLRWLLLGAVGTVVVGGSGFLLPSWATEAAPALAVVPFPAALLVALLRTRLWDVDLVLSRSLTYGLLSGGAVAVYVGAVAVLGGVVGDSAGAPVLATVVVALLVLPLQARLQRLVNRLVHGDADDPYTALARLGDRLEASAEPAAVADSVLPELVRRTAGALRAPYVAVALADGTTTTHGEPVPVTADVPLLYGGAQVGHLDVGGTALSRTDRRRLEHLARQAAVAVHSVLLARDAQRARRETATAREEERRRIRRDLHDGLGPALAAVALQAETARDLVHRDPDAAERLLERLVPRLNEAVADVRALVHDLRPPTLDELGLAGSVRELATRFATPTRAVHVEVAELDPLPAAVDLAAYRIVAESLANAAKHAGATQLRLALSRSASALEVRISDDGTGVPDGAVAGVGLRSMRDRAEELGGTCAVLPGADGRGTIVVASIPLQREA